MRYRVQQFWQAVKAKPLTSAQWAVVDEVLHDGERPLFRQFTMSDQQHSYAVWQTLMAAGHTHPALQKAALLHDIGKTRVNWYLWDRVLVVLGEKIVPQQSQRWGQQSLTWWRKPFVVRAQHALWGAQMAEQVGSDPLTVELIKRHQDSLLPPYNNEEDRLLAHLQWADDLN